MHGWTESGPDRSPRCSATDAPGACRFPQSPAAPVPAEEISVWRSSALPPVEVVRIFIAAAARRYMQRTSMSALVSLIPKFAESIMDFHQWKRVDRESVISRRPIRRRSGKRHAGQWAPRNLHRDGRAPAFASCRFVSFHADGFSQW